MEDLETLFFFMIGIALSCGVGYLGSKRKIGFGWAFAIALVYLFVGLIITLCSKKKDVHFVDVKKED